MSDPTLGNWALGILGVIIAAAIAGAFRSLLADRARITKQFETEKEAVHLLLAQLEARLTHAQADRDKHLQELEVRLYGRMAQAEAQIDKQEDKMSDAVHDLQQMDSSQGMQLGIHNTMLENVNASLQRVEAAMAANVQGSQFEQILKALAALQKS